MGITAGELVRGVFFSRTKSLGSTTHDHSTMKNNAAEKRRWSSVRSYLCGEEFNSVLAEEDSASVKSSEVTVTQPLIPQETPEDFQTKETEKSSQSLEKPNSTARLFRQEDAAVVIQTAFRGFLARRRNAGIEKDVEGSPSRESLGTSVEVQTGNSTEAFSSRQEILAVQHRLQHKSRTPVSKSKEDWDDSTVSSNIIKMRIQNRLEATTRRERALAYAFSQQLRICSKKKQNKYEGNETNMGWSWLERWMATRLPESSSIDQSKAMSQHVEPIIVSVNRRSSAVRKRILDIAGEEKESCGSNEVSVQFDSVSSVSAVKEREDFKLPGKTNGVKAARGISRRKTVPSSNFPREISKASKKDCPTEDEKEKKHKQKRSGSKREINQG